MAAFPSTLPYPLAAGYGIEPQSQVVRTEMEVGQPRVRRRSAVRFDIVSVGWVFSEAEMSAFRDWFDSSADGAGGAAWFDITLRSGDGTVACEARFAETWRASLSSKRQWSVSARLEVRYA